MRSVCFLLALTVCQSSCKDVPATTSDASLVPRLNVVEVLRIDGMRADLVPVGGILVAPDGAVAVTQPMDQAIRFFSSDGQPLTTLGRRGAGPGEFNRIARMGLVGDTIWVSDPGLGRVTLITPDKSFGRTFLMPSEGESFSGSNRQQAIMRMVPFAMYSDGTILSLAFRDPEQVTVARAGVADGEGQVLAVIQRMADIRSVRTSSGSYTPAEVFPTIPLFAASPHGAFAAIGVAQAENQYGEDERSSNDLAVFSIVMLTATGDTVFDRRYEVPGEPIPQDAVDRAIEARAARLSGDVAAAFRRDAYVPRFWPPVVGLVLADDGAAWVQLRDQTGHASYLVLDAVGAVTGRVDLPPATRVAAVSGSVVWCLVKDENDVESIVRYDVR